MSRWSASQFGLPSTNASPPEEYRPEGTVSDQSPKESDPPTLAWNDTVQLSCG